MPRRPEPVDLAAWTVMLGGPIAYDVWADRHRPQGTLSAAVKWGLRTHRPLGRVVLAAGWTGLSWWLIPHLCRVVTDAVDASLGTPTTPTGVRHA